jgi:hypothetical protein
MYIELKKGYDAYKQFLEMLYADEFKNLPTLPARSGNYGEKGAGSSGVKIYRIIMDDVAWTNPFAWAHHLGLEITHYADVVDIIKENDYEIQGHKIRLEEV